MGEVDRLEDELVHEKEKFKAISDELDQTFAEMSGYKYKKEEESEERRKHFLSILREKTFQLYFFLFLSFLFLLKKPQHKSFKIHDWILVHYVNQMCSTFYTRLFV